MKPKSKAEKTQVDVVKVSFGRLEFHVLGTTPFVINRMAEKAKQELLYPGVRKNRNQRAVTLKHNPTEEFRSSIYQSPLNSAAARIYFPGSAFASVIADTAVDIPGASRAQMERLSKVAELNIPLFGIPKLYMSVVRTGGPSKTPDIRTRAILPEWACTVVVTYVKGLVTERSVTNLFAAGGVIGGVGDGRGKMGFGQYVLCKADDKDFLRIVKTQGRVAQDKAIAAAEPYDAESADLYFWFKQELITREALGSDDEPLTPLVRVGVDGELAEELA